MDNKTAFVVAAIIVIVLLSDIYYFEWGLVTFFGRLVASISEWLAFWR